MRSLVFLLLVMDVASTADYNFRIDCWPESNANKEGCESRGCVYDPLPNDTGPTETPSCFMPRKQMGYKAAKVSERQWKLTKNNGFANPFGGGDIQSLKFSIKEIGHSVLNFRIEASAKRFDVGDLLNLPRDTQPTVEKLSVAVSDDTDPFSFRVERANKKTIFDTSPGGLVFADKFIQLAVLLPSSSMFGWGQNVHPNLKHDFTRYTKWGMFAVDEGPNSQAELDTKNLYGVHPFYIAVEDNGDAHGVLFLNANSQDVLTVPSPGYIYRTIGGILDIYVFPGPTPTEVVQQYTAFVGRSFLPPYWALGFQLCRLFYNSLDDMKNRVAAVRGYEIPFDVAYADIDYMDRDKDFTIGANWTGFPEYVQQLHDWGMHNILIFDPAIDVTDEAFRRALDKNVSFIEWERPDEVPRDIQDLYPLAKNTKILLAAVWPDNHAAFPDFLDPLPATNQWWSDEFKRFHDQIGFDGAWLDLNDPSSFGTNEAHPFYFDGGYDKPKIPPLTCTLNGTDAEWDVPPYKTQAVYYFGEDGFLAHKTVCMRAMSMRGSERQYNVHSLYGWSESRATVKAMHAATGKREVVISRSTFPSSGRFGGNWLGDNWSTWEDLRSAVIGVIEFNLFGIPYVGSDVCGFNGISNEELCLRWQQLGSFHSFYRNHNVGEEDQDPAVWKSVALATKKANEFRYQYLPYLYTLHYKASLYGDTVIRPLFFDFGKDTATLSISEQFMWGPAILVIPVLKKGATNVTGYIPKGVGVSFYSLYDYKRGQKMASGWTDLPSPTTYNTPTFIRSGVILPRQPSALTTVAARSGNLNLLIVPGGDSERSAEGALYWDDGDSIITDISTAFSKTSFTFASSSSASQLSITVTPLKDVTNPSLEYLEIFDYPCPVNMSSFKLDGKTVSIDSQKSSCSPVTKILTIRFTTPIDISSRGVKTLSWN